MSAPPLEKPASKTPQHHFEDGYQPRLILSSSITSSNPSFPCAFSSTWSSPAFMVLIAPHDITMQATRASTTVSVFADCSIPAGLRIGPVPGIFKLGKYQSDRKEVGSKKKVRLTHQNLNIGNYWDLLLHLIENSLHFYAFHLCQMLQVKITFGQKCLKTALSNSIESWLINSFGLTR